MTTARYTTELPRFTRAEFEDRAERARRLMTAAKLDGLMLTSEANMEYLSGFTSQFPWNSQSRPWYFVFPRPGEPMAVIPTGGIENWLRTSWVKDIRAWPSPRPENEGLDLLRDAISGIRRRYGRVGAELGPETRLGMAVADLRRLQRMVRPVELADGADVMRELRLIKCAAEIARIRRVCRVVCDAFDRLPNFVAAGDSEKTIMRKLQAEICVRGVDKTPYVMTRSGRGGVRSFIMGPTDRRVGPGDVLCIDTGSTYDGYFCDFNRNFAFDRPSDEVRWARALLYKATDAGLSAGHGPARWPRTFSTPRRRSYPRAAVATARP